MSLDRLIERIAATGNPTVVGLDPMLEYIPSHLREEATAAHGRTLEAAAAAVLRYNRQLIDAVCDLVPAVKPQAAYYEQFGWQGVRALSETIAYAKEKGLFVLLDGKRNDIGSTMAAYGRAYLGRVEVEGESLLPFGADALTVNGYLGTDTVEPLLELCRAGDKGLFILVKTSNPSSGELQDQMMDGLPVYRHMGELCERWGESCPGKYGYSAVGAVVGATYPVQLQELRAALPHTFFLVPGYGAQGGGAADVAPAFDERGLGAVVNSSRAILTAWKKEGCDPQDFAGAARREVLRMKEDITRFLPPIRL